MPNSKRRTKQVKVDLVGNISRGNILDWLIAIYLVFMMGYLTFNLGGARAETMGGFIVMVGGLVGLHGVGLLLSKPEHRVIDTKALMFVPFLLYVVLHGFFLSPVPWLARGECLLLLQAFLIFWVALHHVRLRSHVWFLLLSFMVIAGFAVLYCYNQYFRLPEILPMGLTQSGQYAGRASGVFGAPTQFAGLMLLVIFPMLVCACVPRLTLVLRILCGYTAGMFILGMYLTYSRGAFVACFVTLVFVPLFVARTWKGRLWGMAGMLMVNVAIALSVYYWGSLFLRERVDLILKQGGEWSRFVMWQAGWGIFCDHPVWGGGLGSFRFLYDQYCPSRGDLEPHYPHNEYLGTLADLGLVGFCLMLIPAGWILWHVFCQWLATPDKTSNGKYKQLRRVPSVKLFIACIMLALGAFAVQSIFEFHLKLPALLFWVAIYFAILCKCYPSQFITLPRNPLCSVMVFVCAVYIAIGLPLSAVKYYQACAYAFEGERRVSQYTKNYATYRSDEAYIDDTIRTLQAAVALEPQHAEAWTWLSAMLTERRRFHPDDTFNIGNEAIVAAEAALDIYAIDEIFWINFGNAVLLHGNHVQAEEAFKRAIAYAPMDSAPWYAYASLLSRLPARRDEALAAVDQALAINPHRGDAKRLRRKILIP